MRSALVLVAVAAFQLAACKKHEAAPAGGSATPGSAEPAPVPAAGSADPAFDRLTQETLEYTYAMVPLLAAFDGDCAAQIERMKKLEPLVQKIRDDEEAVAPGFDVRIKDYMREHKNEVVAKLEAKLAEAHVTRPQLEAKEADIKAKCTMPEFAAEMNRIGVLKKKAP